MATFARITRTSVVEELGKDYVRAIRAKGVAMTPIVLRHVLRNASIPVITVAALEIANLLAGAVIVETVFAWPGLGPARDPVDRRRATSWSSRRSCCSPPSPTSR